VSVRPLEERAKRLGRAGERGPLALGVNSRILELEPENLGALTRRARCNLACDDYPAARADFERALALNPKSALHRQQLREGLREVAEGWDAAERRRRNREERYERRQALFREIEEIAEFAEARALGVLYSGGIRGGPGQGAVGIDRALAAAAFRRAYRLDPRRRVTPGGRPDSGLFEVPTRLAAVYRAQDKPAQAPRVYEWVLSHHDSPFARVGLAAVREDQGRHEEALGHYERVLSERPKDAYALRGVGRVLSSLGRDEEAIATFERAARLADDAGAAERARSSLARLKAALERQGRTEQAKAAAEALGRMGAV
jgi:tetratricopeptide (TPR) repeat protein